MGSRLRGGYRQSRAAAVAFYASGQLLTQTYYAANKLMKVYRRGKYHQFAAVRIFQRLPATSGPWALINAMQL